MKYRALIRRERRELRRRIQATRFPIFNLRRLARGPGEIVGCKESHAKIWEPRDVILLVPLVAFLLLIVTIAADVNWLFLLFVLLPYLILLGAHHLEDFPMWWCYRSELKALRHTLQAEDTDDRLLVGALLKEIDATEEQMFGETCAFSEHVRNMEVRAKEMELAHYRSRADAIDARESLKGLLKFRDDAACKLIEIRRLVGFVPALLRGYDCSLFSDVDRLRIRTSWLCCQVGVDIVYRELRKLESANAEMLHRLEAHPLGPRVQVVSEAAPDEVEEHDSKPPTGATSHV